MKLRPVQYQYTSEKLQQTHQGLIAEEVNEIIPEIVIKQNEKGEETIDLKGQTMGINYSEITPILIKGMQEQQNEITGLKLEIKNLENKLLEWSSLEKRLLQMEQKMEISNTKIN